MLLAGNGKQTRVIVASQGWCRLQLELAVPSTAKLQEPLARIQAVRNAGKADEKTLRWTPLNEGMLDPQPFQTMAKVPGKHANIPLREQLRKLGMLAYA